MKVAFVGLGNMGSGMARNLLKAGYNLTVYNRSRKRTETLRGDGANVAQTPAEAAAGADVLITMLADDHAVEETVLGSEGAGSTLPKGSVHLSMSTISVALSRRLAEVHGKKGQHYLAAPVFGRPDAAAAGKLFVLAGGDAAQIERCRVLFEAMGHRTFIVSDDPAAANLMKLSGNFLITTVIEGLAETFALIRKAGHDPAKFLEVMTESLFNIPVYKNYGGMISKDKFEPVGFRLPLGLKDNRLVLAAAEENSVSMPMANLIHDRFLTAIARGLTEEDWAAIARVSYENAGLTKVA